MSARSREQGRALPSKSRALGGGETARTPDLFAATARRRERELEVAELLERERDSQATLALTSLLGAWRFPERAWPYGTALHGLSEGSEREFELADYMLGRLLRSGDDSKAKPGSVPKRAQRGRTAWEAHARAIGLEGAIAADPGTMDTKTGERTRTRYRVRLGRYVREVCVEAAARVEAREEPDMTSAIKAAARAVAGRAVADIAPEPEPLEREEDRSVRKRVRCVATHGNRAVELSVRNATASAKTRERAGAPVDLGEVQQEAARDARVQVVLAAAGQVFNGGEDARERADRELVVATAALISKALDRGIFGAVLAELGDRAAAIPVHHEENRGQELSAEGGHAGPPSDVDDEPEPGGHAGPPDAMTESWFIAETLASVGVERFGVSFLEPSGNKLAEGDEDAGERPYRTYTAAELLPNLPAIMRRNERDGHSVSLRFRFTDGKEPSGLLHVEDADEATRRALADLAAATIETSPGSSHAIFALVDYRGRALADAKVDEVLERMVRKFAATGLNRGPSGAVRIGINQKPNRRLDDGTQPRVRLRSTRPGARVTVADLEAAGLLAAPLYKFSEDRDKARRLERWRERQRFVWPDYEETAGGDVEYRAIWAWMCEAARRGFASDEIAERAGGMSDWLGRRSSRTLRAWARRAARKQGGTP